MKGEGGKGTKGVRGGNNFGLPPTTKNLHERTTTQNWEGGPIMQVGKGVPTWGKSAEKITRPKETRGSRRGGFKTKHRRIAPERQEGTRLRRKRVKTEGERGSSGGKESERKGERTWKRKGGVSSRNRPRKRLSKVKKQNVWAGENEGGKREGHWRWPVKTRKKKKLSEN